MTEQTEHDQTDQLRQLLEGQRFMMFTTQDDAQALVSRPMTVQEFEDWVFRFIAQDDDAVTRQADGRQVNLSVMDGTTYASLSGTGRVERDVSKKRELWDRLTEAYAGDPEDPANIIIEVTASAGEYWDGGNRVGNVIGLARAALTGKRPDQGEHGTARL
ncbi:General stress protein 26 [Raineyella antarctica]|uniref:General stress protein 26 n=1 Tax=Raineyella antarctica TaxID=1577474 RepID=A0A1G6GFH0_9ACTN|nr:pyridoxamine 5'-phosphate oxidase family protein [Raineyella antarctica]SDB80563.1 General stress protein 26 [Raineyella antarctica]